MEKLDGHCRLPFGKYKGKTIVEVFESDPGYLCWMKKTGYEGLADDVLEAIASWEDAFPKEVAKIERSIAKAKTKEILKEDIKPKPEPIKPVASPDLVWGSW